VQFVAEVEDALPAEPVKLAKVVKMLADVFKHVPKPSLVAVATALRSGEFWVKIAASRCVTADRR
jgi:hypothetical protein